MARGHDGWTARLVFFRCWAILAALEFCPHHGAWANKGGTMKYVGMFILAAILCGAAVAAMAAGDAAKGGEIAPRAAPATRAKPISTVRTRPRF